MKVRSEEELQKKLQGNLKHRKTELIFLKGIIQGANPNDKQRQVLLRAAIPLLYSHWEGFVKYAANSYLQFINAQGLRYGQLAPSLVGLALRGKITEAQQSQFSHIARTQLVKILVDQSDTVAKIPIDDDDTIDGERAVSTANLNSKVLLDIIALLGLDPCEYAQKEALIDKLLLKTRNNIAHGEFMPVSKQDYETLHEEVIALLERFQNDVLNAATLRTYLRRGSSHSPST